MKLLKFSTGNAKLGKRLIFSIPAGIHVHVLVYVRLLLTVSLVRSLTCHSLMGLLQMSIVALLLCQRPGQTYRDARWYNWDLLKEVMYSSDNQTSALTGLIELSIAVQPVLDICRIHESGDFWTELYMRAWLNAARNHSDIKFYAYTKSLGMWLNLKQYIPSNFYLTASVGGTLDTMIPGNLDTFKRIAYVVYTEQQAEELGLEIDHDDEHCFGDKPFALLVHSPQRAGSLASQALTQRKKDGMWTGYNKVKVAA
jgi:hypothetical protein